MEQRQEFIRHRFSGNGMMFLFCARCGQLVAYSARPEMLSISEAAHSKFCRGKFPDAKLPLADEPLRPQ